MRSLTQNILKTFTTQIPSIIISILSGVFLTRLLGAEYKGVYALFNANIEIMVMIFVFGFNIGIIYFGSNKKISNKKLQSISLLLISIVFPIITVLVFMADFKFLFPDKYDSLFFKVFLLGMFYLRVLNTFFNAFLKTTKSFKYINRIDLLHSIFNLLAFSTLFWLEKEQMIELNLKLIFTFSLSLLLINSAICFYSFFKTNKLELDFNIRWKEDLLPIVIYISPIFVGLTVNFLNYRFDIWLVSYFKGNIQLGFYVLAVNFAQFILLYSRIIGSVMLPYLSEDNDEQRRKYFSTYSRINFFSVMVFIIVLWFIGDDLMILLYGKEFTDSISPFNILLFGMVFTAMNQLFGMMFTSKGKTHIPLIATSLGLIATIVFDLILIPRYGIDGAAVATVITYFTTFLTFILILTIKEKFSFLELFVLKKSDINTLFKK